MGETHCATYSQRETLENKRRTSEEQHVLFQNWTRSIHLENTYIRNLTAVVYLHHRVLVFPLSKACIFEIQSENQTYEPSAFQTELC